MPHCILLDRDGVLNQDLPGSVLDLEHLRLLPGATEAVALLGSKGYEVLVATNQACVGRGELSEELLREMHRFIDREVEAAGGRISGWFVCTHRDEDGCACRKPRPGLLVAARDAFGFDPSQTRFVGDAERDVQAARAAGCLPVLVRTGKGSAAHARLPDVPCHDDLLALARSLPSVIEESP